MILIQETFPRKPHTGTRDASYCQHCWRMIAFLDQVAEAKTRIMASLSVRKLDDETLERLRVRAARHGVSMEEEARRILKAAVSAPENLGDLAVQMFGPSFGVDLELPKREPHEPIRLSQ